MRRARPKSYVLATSTSFPETEQMSFSQDESRELSSHGSLSSIDRTPRLANRVHNHSHSHRIQKFIAFFTHQFIDVLEDIHGGARASEFNQLHCIKRRPDRSPELWACQPWLVAVQKVLQNSSSPLLLAGRNEFQELALGKSGKRRSWEECWAMLYEQSLYLCAHEPIAKVAETTGEKSHISTPFQLIHLPPCARVDVNSSIIDIAYEWLAMSRTKHVIRLVTQTRTEHLFELDSEAEMLSWIATLQSCAEGTMSPELYSSCSMWIRFHDIRSHFGLDGEDKGKEVDSAESSSGAACAMTSSQSPES
ncbi:unnamed protein product [Angiostrongylus costaricensis]|uniref:PH domain-containing protein n=1 Tax=Angiostrongylus costaricensis TaxID=334426 RepID=A0A0R3PUX5_ANGCS|nr:unnamed protein product [Angiostrongylus costaricensis]